ncbi:uncharacterized protein ACA1_030790 [Acanthamoeba castellanii str. Neff]|uniref:Uncharacterized protein n=1 Tax=Acanthamoeba castellanii (strain ATCC 30010 / Neff) TaxID=1257118 RepID=L8HIF2_ACACF|nr:uncharacterized protein ACA1_030790 [Acanthamoeba castellanii str. Neff]ELR24985.1 hypothetical protein ACA1_030790 [Acanthamoeba castellanii str. Neff]
MAALLGLESGKNEERKELARGSDLVVVRLGGRALEPLDSIWKRNSRYGVRRVFYTVGQPSNREMDELVAMGEDGKEIITPPGEIDFDPLRKAEEEGMKEGWWMEKVGDLKYKMERLLKLELSRYKHRQCDHDPIPFIKAEKKECAIG